MMIKTGQIQLIYIFRSMTQMIILFN